MTDTPPPAAPEPTPAQPAANAYQAAPAAPAYQSTGYAAPAKWNVLSIVTLALGVLGFAIVPVITGFISLNQIKKTGEQGKVLAIIGLILGFLGVIGWIIFWVVWGAILASGTMTTY